MNQQFVLMSIPQGDGIKMETHESHDQFIRIEKGEGKAIIGNSTYKLKDGTAFIIPAGTSHQISNTSNSEPLKLYTIYSPPEHPDKLTQSTNPDKFVDQTNNVIIDTDSDELVSQSVIEKELYNIKKELTQKGGYTNYNKKEIDYEKKYNEYKNKYITLKILFLNIIKNFI